MGHVIIGTGSYVPEKVVRNEDLLEYVNLSEYDEKRGGPYPDFVERVMGFKERRIAADNQATSDLAYEAAKIALDTAGLNAIDLDLIIVSTASADKKAPNTASILQSKLGAGECSFAFDVGAACPGFVWGLHIADSMMNGYEAYNYALVIGAEKMSSIVDKRHYITSPTFGDGAGAVVLKKASNDLNLYGLLSSYAKSDGERGNFLDVPSGGSFMPITPENASEIYEKGLFGLQMKAHATKEFAIHKLEEATRYVLRREGLSVDDISWFLPHQASGPFIRGAVNALGLPDEKVLTNLEKYANTSQASTPILLHENRNRFKIGDLLAIASMGGGLGWGASLYRWFDYAQLPREVLIVDDEPDAAEGIVLALKGLTRRDNSFTTKINYNIAKSGNEMVELIKTNSAKYDIAIVDQRMPGLTGLEAIIRAGRIQKDLICCILTGQADDKDKQDMIRSGEIAELMYKPFLDPNIDDRFNQPNYLTFKNIIERPYLYNSRR